MIEDKKRLQCMSCIIWCFMIQVVTFMKSGRLNFLHLFLYDKFCSSLKLKDITGSIIVTSTLQATHTWLFLYALASECQRRFWFLYKYCMYSHQTCQKCSFSWYLRSIVTFWSDSKYKMIIMACDWHLSIFFLELQICM